MYSIIWFITIKIIIVFLYFYSNITSENRKMIFFPNKTFLDFWFWQCMRNFYPGQSKMLKLQRFPGLHGIVKISCLTWSANKKRRIFRKFVKLDRMQSRYRVLCVLHHQVYKTIFPSPVHRRSGKSFIVLSPDMPLAVNFLKRFYQR